MYTTKEQQPFEMDQQQQQQMGQQNHANGVSEDNLDGSGAGGGGGLESNANDGNNGVRGSLGSLGGPRMSAGDMLYDGHGGVQMSSLTPAQAVALQQQQQAMAAAANYRYMTLPSHTQMIPGTEYVYTSGGPVGNHTASSQPYVSVSQNQPIIYTTNPAAVAQQQQQQIQQPYDRCPAICSLFAIFCCPITFWCSLPALAYSLCAYTDYRANDMHAYRSKSDVARRCVIIACIIGLILCIIWAIMTFLFYAEMLMLLSDIIKAIQRQIWPGN